MHVYVCLSVFAQGARALYSYLKASLVTDTIKIKKKRFTYVSVSFFGARRRFLRSIQFASAALETGHDTTSRISCHRK